MRAGAEPVASRLGICPALRHAPDVERTAERALLEAARPLRALAVGVQHSVRPSRARQL